MKNFKKITFSLLIASSIACSTSAFANVIASTNLEYSLGYMGPFYCTVSSSDPSATVGMDTNRMDVYGFCSGSPYVDSDGHIINMPMSKVNAYAFWGVTVKRNGPFVQVEVNSNDPKATATINCRAYVDGGRPQWPNNGKMCVTPPAN